MHLDGTLLDQNEALDKFHTELLKSKFQRSEAPFPLWCPSSVQPNNYNANADEETL